MRVKRYVVDSMPEALQQIRSDLGKDAVILNTKEIRTGGFLGLFSKKKIEVIAATDSASAPNAPRSRPSGGTPPPAPSVPAMHSHAKAAVAVIDQPSAVQHAPPSNGADAAAAANAFIEQLAAAQAAQTAQAPQITQAVQQPVPVVSPQQGAALYGNTTPPAAPSVKSPAAPVVTGSAPVVEDAVLTELRAMKQMMEKLTSIGSLGAGHMNPELARLKKRLLDQEVLPELADLLLSELEEKAMEAEEELTEDNAVYRLKDQLRIKMGANTSKPLQPETRIAHFVGPTGVGKTTTIAKLAAEQVLKHRRKVGFITSDTFRIAAVDQLKTYATILGVPLEVVFSPLDLKKAFESLHDCDIIFMDTAGRNFRNEMYVSELNALLQAGGKSETYLVLSLTMKYKDMRAIADNFSKFNVDKVLFTKRDETDTFGSILNLLHEFPLQLSYITTGQNVPDDLAVVNENELIDLILEERSDE